MRQGLVNWQRAVKSEAELALMRQAGQIVGRMHERIVEKVEPGIRKCDLVADIYDAALRYDPAIGAGGDYPALGAAFALGRRCLRAAFDLGRRADEVGRGNIF